MHGTKDDRANKLRLLQGILAEILRPWHALLKRQCPGAMHRAFIDDQSLRADGHPILQRALAYTSQFDTAVGLKKDLGKRQIWS